MAKAAALQNCLVICLMTISIFAQQDTGIEMKADVKPPFRPSEDHTLMFPMLKRDYSNWGSLGSAVFLTNKAVIAPEASNTKGLIYTTQANPFREHWYALIDFNMTISVCYILRVTKLFAIIFFRFCTNILDSTRLYIFLSVTTYKLTHLNM